MLILRAVNADMAVFIPFSDAVAPCTCIFLIELSLVLNDLLTRKTCQFTNIKYTPICSFFHSIVPVCVVGCVALLYILWYFLDRFYLLYGKSWSIDVFMSVDFIGGNFGIYYLIFGNDILIVLYRRLCNYTCMSRALSAPSI